MAKQTSSPKRGRGRPKAFAGQARLKAAVVRVVKEEGKLGPARDRLAKGILVPRTGPQAKVVKIDISLPTLSAVAAEGGVELKRGRPAAAA